MDDLKTIGSQPPTTAEPENGNVDLARVREASDRVHAKHADSSTPARGRGRPRKDGTPPRPSSPGTASTPVAPATPPPPVSPPIDPEIIARTVKGLLTVTDSVLVARIERRALMLSKDEGLAKSISQEAGLKVVEVDMISDLAGLVCSRNNLLGQYAPEILLCVCLGNYGIRMAVCMRKLSVMEEHQRAAMKPKNADTPQSVQAPDNGKVGNG